MPNWGRGIPRGTSWDLQKAVRVVSADDDEVIVLVVWVVVAVVVAMERVVRGVVIGWVVRVVRGGVTRWAGWAVKTLVRDNNSRWYLVM